MQIVSLAQAQERSTLARGPRPSSLERLFIEETRLRGGDGGSFASSDADDSEHAQFCKGSARDVDAVGIRMKVGRGKVESLVHKIEEVIGDDPFKQAIIEETKLHP